MNKVILMGRATRDTELRYSQGEQSTAVANYTIAVDRKIKRQGEQDADFISCVAFGKTAEFAEKYIKQGTKIVITGRIQTGNYTNKEGVKVYTTQVVVEEQEFAESKKVDKESKAETKTEKKGKAGKTGKGKISNGYMNIPVGLDEELPFS